MFATSTSTAETRHRHGSRSIHRLYVLDNCFESINAGHVNDAMAELFDFLYHARCGRSLDEWKAFVGEIREHRLIQLILTCPIARRSFERPRGYAGDAVLIDHLYGCGEATAAPYPGTLTGQIYSYLSYAPATRAVRFRRSRLASLIDDATASGNGDAHIVSIAAGHLREIELTRAYTDAAIADRSLVGTLTALDHDPESLAAIAKDYARYSVQTVRASAKQVVTRSIEFSNVSLIYAAGLFDYLQDSFAEALTKTMFESLRSGGKMLLANFLPNIADCGFMEAVMDWWLVYRTEHDLEGLLEGIPSQMISSVRAYRDSDQQIAFLEATRA